MGVDLDRGHGGMVGRAVEAGEGRKKQKGGVFLK